MVVVVQRMRVMGEVGVHEAGVSCRSLSWYEGRMEGRGGMMALERSTVWRERGWGQGGGAGEGRGGGQSREVQGGH